MLPSGGNGFVWPLGIPKPHAGGGGSAFTPSSLDAFGFGGASPTGSPNGQGLAGIGTQGSLGVNGNFGGINFGASLPGGLSATVPGFGGVNAGLFGSIAPSLDTGNQMANTLGGKAISGLGGLLGVPTSLNVLGMLSPALAGILGAINPALAAPGLMSAFGNTLSGVMANQGVNTTNNMLSSIMGLYSDPNLTFDQAHEIAQLAFTQAFGPSGSIFGNTAPGQTSLFGAQGGGLSPGGYGGYGGQSGDPSAPGALSLSGLFGSIFGQGRGDTPDGTGPAGPAGPAGEGPGGPGTGLGGGIGDTTE